MRHCFDDFGENLLVADENMEINLYSSKTKIITKESTWRYVF